MPAAFTRTLRSLDADRPVAAAVCVPAAAALLAAFASWMLLGEVTLYEVVPLARIEADRAAHAVDSPVDGRIAEFPLELGRDVAAGDVVAVLDSGPQVLAVEAARARLDSVRTRIATLERQRLAEEEALAAVDAALAADERKARADVEKGRADVARARAEVEAVRAETARLAESAAVLERLVAERVEAADAAREARSKVVVAKARLDGLAAEVAALEAAVAAQEAAVETLAPARAVERKDRRVRVESLVREAAALEGEMRQEESEIRRLEGEVRARTIRAPIAGRVAEAPALVPGSVVAFGRRLTVIVPRSTPRVVAGFGAQAAGRVRPGQSARLRFDGFPWTRFGFRGAEVARVGAAGADGVVPVELAVDPGERSAIPLEHGLACTAEIEVERVAPADLVLRGLGRVLPGGPAH